MLYIVSKNDFVNELMIAGLEKVSVCQQVCAMIFRYEPEYLKQVLGYSFYKVVLAALGDGTNVEQKYADLVDGVDYVVDDVTYHWQGLRTMTASYIYYWYHRMNFSQTTGIGEETPTSENSISAWTRDKMVQAYNASAWGSRHYYCYEEMSAQQQLYHYLTNNEDAFTDFKRHTVKIIEPINIFNL